jgi:gluconolactonase
MSCWQIGTDKLVCGTEESKMRRFRFVGSVLIMLPALVAHSQSSIVADGAQVEKLGGGYKFTEGPAADKNGDVYFIDQGLTASDAHRILQWSAADYEKRKAAHEDVSQALTVWFESAGRSNGMCFDNKGCLISCADEKNELWSIDREKKVTVLIKDYKGQLLDGPNDVWVRPDNGMYLTDPYYHRPWWGPEHATPQQDKRAVYFLSPDAKTLTRVIDDLVMPNGIIGLPDGKTLYVSDINGRQTWKYEIQKDGTLKNKTLFCNVGSDGMTVDDQGNVYMTSGAVIVCDKTGQQIERITMPVIPPATRPEGPANVCFGGKDHDILFVTARTSIYGLRMKVKGVGSQ